MEEIVEMAMQKIAAWPNKINEKQTADVRARGLRALMKLARERPNATKTAIATKSQKIIKGMAAVYAERENSN